MGNYSTISIRETNESKKVKIGSDLKPVIADELVSKWQALIDAVAKIADVPSGLIMRLNTKNIEVFLKSNTDSNPYERGEVAELVHGLYCETVIGTQKQLLVPDATKSSIWKDNNPDVDINMISYLGQPINWPDGEVFGTVCILDSKANDYNELIKQFVFHVKQHIEADLELVCAKEALESQNERLELLNSTKTRFLSLISHDLRSKIGAVDQLLKFAGKRYDEFDHLKIKSIIATASESISSSYNLLENLLIWAKNDFVQLNPRKTEVNIATCFDTLLQEFSIEISQKNIEIVKDYYALNSTIRADKNMLLVILRNVLSNAIKYTNEFGMITIRILLAENGHLIIIEDTGIGMDKDTVDHLFRYSAKHHSKGTRGESSAGIGLMLIKEFLDKHDAKISIESEVEIGTKVKILWP